MKIAFLLADSLPYDRLGLMSLSAIAKQAGHSVRVFIETGRPFEIFLQDIRRFDPAAICYTAMTGEHNRLQFINAQLKHELSFFSIWGGPHATFMPSLILDPDIDAVCVGEGEEAFRELLGRLEAGRDYFDVRNFCFKHNGQIRRNELRPLIDNLDDLPFADRDALYEASPWLRDESSKSFMATRGCPYKCSYCFNHAYTKMYEGKGSLLRHRSVGSIIREIQETKMRYPIRIVYLCDEIFPIKPLPWVEEFAERFPKEVGLPIMGLIRPDFANERIIALMEKAGFHSVCMGLESADEYVANEILQRNLANDQISEARQLLRRHSINVVMQNILGHPVADPVSVDLRTLDMNIRLKPTYAWVNILCPYPGLRITDYVLEKGFFKREQLAELPLTPKTVSQLHYPSVQINKQVARLHKLFGIVVHFPFLRRLVPLLIRLPLDWVYIIIYWVMHGYCMEFVLKKDRRFWRVYRYILPFFRYLRMMYSGGKQKETTVISVQSKQFRRVDTPEEAGL